MLLVVNLLNHFLKTMTSKNSGFPLEFWALNGLGRSGRPVGIISTYFRQNPSGGFRAMTKKPKKLTTKKVTTTLM